MQGMLGADLIGFHIYDYARHFLSSAARIEAVEHNHGQITYKGRKLLADTFPIGIDYDKIVKTVNSTRVKNKVKEIKKHYENQKIVVSIDRLDYTKGILQRLEAFELLLSEHPEYHQKIALTMIAVPSRTEVETYQNLRDSIEITVSRINGKYANVNWTPISYQFRNLPFEDVMSMYAAADIALVTPLRDGMNLVAKEFVAAKQDKDGVLILSELAGAIDELPEAISINPNSTRSIKDALMKALNMDAKDRSKKLEKMQKRLQEYNVKDWAIDFMGELENTSVLQSEHEQKLLTPDMQNILLNSYKNSEKRLFLLDYDGTLRDFVDSSNPAKAIPPKKLINILKKLSSDPKNSVCIVSGRSKEALDSWFKDIPITLVAEHGAWTKINKNWIEQPSSFESHRTDLLQILKKYSKRTAGAHIEEKTHALVWHYRGVKTELAYARNINLIKDIERYIKDTDLSIYQGNKILEIKPENINKGIVAYSQYEKTDPDFILCIGDDYTDEDMFETLPEQAFTIKVGLQETEALFHLKDIASVYDLLRKISLIKISE
jgi:trehalose 6-phosphate synthase/phosphatase